MKKEIKITIEQDYFDILQTFKKNNDIKSNSIAIEKILFDNYANRLKKPFEYFTINNRRYLGSKTKILDFIQKSIDKHIPTYNSFLDIFSGTGVVASHFNNRKIKIITNDMLFSNYVIHYAFLSDDKYDKNKISDKNIITWAKTNPMPSITKRTYTHSSEFIVYAVKNKKWTFNYKILKDINPDKAKDGKNKQMRDVWNLPQCQGKERIKDPKTNRAVHPTQKLEELVRRAILGSSNENDLVLDLFMGSGTTAVVSKKNNRNFIGCDLEEKYIKVANNRLKDIDI